jgi:hypothetical protein
MANEKQLKVPEIGTFGGFKLNYLSPARKSASL